MKYQLNSFAAVGLLVVALAACSAAGLFGGQSNDDLAGLSDGTWVLQAYGPEANLTPALPDRQVTLIFDHEEKTAGGSAGCNSYSGSFTLSGSKLSFGSMMSTLMACFPEEVNAQESAYLSLLAQVSGFRLADDTLELTAADGQILRFQKMAAPVQSD